jgi:hypothetical protein
MTVYADIHNYAMHLHTASKGRIYTRTYATTPCTYTPPVNAGYIHGHTLQHNLHTASKGRIYIYIYTDIRYNTTYTPPVKAG